MGYQRLILSPATQSTLAGHRGVPDVSWLADPCQGILTYNGFLGDPSQRGWSPTSTSAPNTRSAS